MFFNGAVDSYSKRLLIICLLFQSSSGATLVTETLVNGTRTVTCTAKDVLDMSWSVVVFHSYHGLKQFDFEAILSSARVTIQVMEEITLSSEVSQELSTPYSEVRSTMTVNPSETETRSIHFSCRGQTTEPYYFHEIAILDNMPTYPMGTEQTSTRPPLGPTNTTNEEFTTKYSDPIAPSVPENFSNSTSFSTPTNHSDSKPNVPNHMSPSQYTPLEPKESSTLTTVGSDSSIPVGIWIALGVLSFLIIALVIMTIIVCCLAFKYKKKRTCLPEMLHHYDYVSSHRGIYSPAPSTVSQVHMPSGDEDDLESQYMDMVPNASYAGQNQVNTDHLSFTNLGSPPGTASQYNMRINSAYNGENDIELTSSTS